MGHQAGRPVIYVFISHQQSDSYAATRIHTRLNAHPKIIAYIDVLDPHLLRSGEAIAGYLRTKINDSTHLMAVVSTATERSWWVPFEIGIATQHGSAIATYAVTHIELPSYLRSWPYLRTESDLEQYIEVATREERRLSESLSKSSSTTMKATYAQRFHSELRRTLGQA